MTASAGIATSAFDVPASGTSAYGAPGYGTPEYEEPAAAAVEESADAQAAIVVVCREPGARETLSRELSKRYGADYQIVVCDQPGELEPWMRDLALAGLPVAMVIAGVGAQDPDGIDILAESRRIDPTTVRVATVAWGDWDYVRSVFDAITRGKIDHWVTQPVQAPAEEFHRSITEFLREWNSQRGEGFQAVRVIGEQWSARSQELRDLFARHRVPTGFYDVDSAGGRRLLNELGVESPELPIVVIAFAAERSTLINPSNQEIADAFGIMTPISAEQVFDVAVVGAGPSGLAAAVSASSEGLRTVVVENEAVGGRQAPAR